MINQKLKGLIKGWKNEINKLEQSKIRPELSNSEASIMTETLNRCINDLELLILIEYDF